MTEKRITTVVVRIGALLLALPAAFALLEGIIEVLIQGYFHEVDISQFVMEPLLIVIAVLMFLKAGTVATLLAGVNKE